jgi:hypothetical protein
MLALISGMLQGLTRIAGVLVLVLVLLLLLFCCRQCQPLPLTTSPLLGMVLASQGHHRNKRRIMITEMVSLSACRLVTPHHRLPA